MVLRFALQLMFLALCAGLLPTFAAEGPGYALAAEAGSSSLPVPDVSYEKQVVPLLKKYCFQCHAGAKAKSDLPLDEYQAEPAALKKRDIWEKVQDNLESAAMPPEGKPQPTDAERQLILNWIDVHALKTNCSGEPDPGRVTIRRLNRVEYTNTIRDLTGVEFTGAEDFPSDDVGYGFDNIGDVLSLPPLLLERYLAAAETIASRAINSGDPSQAPSQRFAAAKMQHTSGGKQGESAHNLNSSGEVFSEIDFAKPGEYLLRARAYGQQAGPEPARMGFRLDNAQVHVADVTAIDKAPGVYEKQVQIEAGKHRVALAFLNDFYDEKADPKQRDRNLVVESLEVLGPLGIDPVALPESHRRIIFCQPGEKTSADCARLILRAFASRAFRRPANDDEVERLVRLVALAEKEGDRFERGIQLAVQAVLVSPQFLFRVELDPQSSDPHAVRVLNDYELASRMSYFLWSTMPDDELLQHARQGTLRKGTNLEAEIRRMLGDPRSRALVENFAGQWLQLRNLKNLTPDKVLFPEFDEPLRAAMKTETELFFTEIIREDRNVLDLLDADFSFVNARLAKHYGMPGVEGDQFRRVALDSAQRGGLLGQAAILAVTSNPTRTSPVKRGKWILENLLGAPPPPPPPGVPELNEEKDKVLTGSLRQRMEQHRENPSCAACHQRMDPLGFGLENYDAVGAWRTADGNFPIDPAGVLPGGRSFKSPAELRAILKSMPVEFRRCLAEKLLTYALGRGVEYYDKCAIDHILSGMDRRQNKFSALVLEIVNSDPFQKRRSKRGNEP